MHVVEVDGFGDIDAQIERTKAKIVELKRSGHSTRHLKIELEIWEDMRKCASRRKLSR